MKKQLFTLVALLAMAGMAMAQDISAVRQSDGSWGFTMPARNLSMTYELYSSNDPNGYTISGIPDGWLVIAAGDTVTITNGVTTPITAGAPISLIPPANQRRRIASVTLVDALPSIITLDNTMTAWTTNTYAVPEGGLTFFNAFSVYGSAIIVSGNVTLLLTAGTTLTLNKGISLAEGATLTVEGTGTMVVNGSDENTISTVAGTGTLVLTSGTLTARGGNGGEIYEGYYQGEGFAGGVAINGNVVVNGGTLTATGGNGGNVGQNSEDSHSGAGGAAISGSLTINSGTVTRNNGTNGQVGTGCTGCTAGAGGMAVAGTVTDNR